MISIISWNIRQGGGSRLSSIIAMVSSESPSILVCSEYRNNQSGILLRNKLLALGYRHHLVSAAPSNDNSVLIASQFPFNGLIFPKADEHYPHHVIEAEFDAFQLIGVYLPHKKKHKLFPFLIDRVTACDKPSIIVGDYNTGKNYIDQKGDSFWYTDELSRLEATGMTDAYRHIHGDKTDYSWYSHQGNGYRYDHSYVEEPLLPIVTACDYLHQYRESGISDHSPMVLNLG